jgi:hypothetical protein
MPLLTELGLCFAGVSTNISLLAELLAAASFGPGGELFLADVEKEKAPSPLRSAGALHRRHSTQP